MLERNSRQRFRSQWASRMGLGVVAVVALLGAQPGCRGGAGKKENGGTEMARFRTALKAPSFNEQTAALLAKLDNYAHRADGDDALDAWFLLGRTRFDWFMTALLNRDDRVFSRLLAHLRTGAASCDKVTHLSPLCTSRLRTALAAPFKKVVELESGGGHGYSEQARQFLSLLDFLLDKTRSKIPAKLVGVRGPAGTRTRLLLACRAQPPGRQGDAVRWVTQWWERQLPFPCRMPLTVPLGDLQQALLAGRCDYPCRDVQVKPADPLAFLSKSLKVCPHDALGFDLPAQAYLFTPVSFVATQALRMLSEASRLLASERSDPMVKRFSACSGRLKSLVRDILLRLPLPAAVSLSAVGRLALPVSKRDRVDSLPALPVVTAHAKGWFVGLFPALSIDGEDVLVDKGRKGWVFPGRKVDPPRNGDKGAASLWGLLTASMRIEGTTPAMGVVLYVDRGMALKDLAKVLSVLADKKVPYVWLASLHGDLPMALAGRRLFLGPAPKEASNLEACLKLADGSEGKGPTAGGKSPVPSIRRMTKGLIRRPPPGPASRPVGRSGSGRPPRGAKGPACCRSHTAARAVAALQGGHKACVVSKTQGTVQELFAKMDRVRARIYWGGVR